MRQTVSRLYYRKPIHGQATISALSIFDFFWLAELAECLPKRRVDKCSQWQVENLSFERDLTWIMCAFGEGALTIRPAFLRV
jgi:hypothetical protein